MQIGHEEGGVVASELRVVAAGSERVAAEEIWPSQTAVGQVAAAAAGTALEG